MDLSTHSVQSSFELAQSTAKQQSMAQTAHGLNGKTLSDTKINEAAQKFEAMFLSQMLNYMMPKMDTTNPFNGGKGEEVFKSFMTNEYATLMAKTGKTGIADVVAKEMIRIQAAQNEQTQGEQ